MVLLQVACLTLVVACALLEYCLIGNANSNLVTLPTWVNEFALEI